MACDDRTPWTPTDHPHPLYRLRISGGATDPDTGEWIPETTASLRICGSIGRGMGKGISRRSTSTMEYELMRLDGAQFKAGDLYLICHSDCDVGLNDLIKVHEDDSETIIHYWRVLMKLKTLGTMLNISGYGQDYWLIRMEER